MSLTNDEIFEMASAAVRAMYQRYGPDFKFPADVIWQNMPQGVDIPSTKRPHQPARLIRAGLLEKTGGMTKAQSESRAGSPTAEYRFGPELVPRVKTPSDSQAFSKRSTSESLAGIQMAMDSEGYVISVAELANFYLAITVSPLVVLSGISGTGKSLLPRKFAKQTNSFFHAIPVQPQWSDNSDLFGYVPTLSPTKYIKGALIDSLLEAKRNPQKLVIALLDEMNLAPVEHYFSDFLSVAETRVRDDKGITTDKLPIELPDDVPGQSSPHIDLLRGIQLPPNLRVVGTANMDETTHTFSPKVLDRAFTIEFDDPDLTAFASGQRAVKGGSNAFDELANIAIRETNAISVQEAYAASQDLFEHIALLLSEIQDILAPAGIKFGYRTRDAILLYLHFWRELKLAEILTGYAALDFCILQKILPKVAGSGEALAEALTNLTTWLNARAETQEDADGVLVEFSGPLARSVQKVERMTELLNLDGSTRYWGA
ncbi:McrB family protein [Pseudomonas viridiflava]|uniref:McrB family protein n=1 Tax=Pseudomonas viridiflava TaxID=33069 RepID=UPI000F0260E5|nr:hypothetical protein [Pseudomonas viridiflava]